MPGCPVWGEEGHGVLLGLQWREQPGIAMVGMVEGVWGVLVVTIRRSQVPDGVVGLFITLIVENELTGHFSPSMECVHSLFPPAQCRLTPAG